MEYTYFTIEYPDYEGGTWTAYYRHHQAQDENGTFIEVEEGDESGNEWEFFQGFNTLRQMQAWIKREEKELKSNMKYHEQERKHDAQMAEIEAYMQLGMTEEEAEAIVTRDIDAELAQEAKTLEELVAEYA